MPRSGSTVERMACTPDQRITPATKRPAQPSKGRSVYRPAALESRTTAVAAQSPRESEAAASSTAEFSFFLGIPVMFGASLLKLVKFGFAFTGTEIGILAAGMATAFVISILAIRFLMGYIRKNDFKAFGYYRIVLGILVLAYFLLLG